MLKKKRINKPSLEDPISTHLKWCHDNFIKTPISSNFVTVNHTQHVMRVLLNIPVLISLHRRYNCPHALSLKSDDIKLLQIATLALCFNEIKQPVSGNELYLKKINAFYSYLNNTLKVNLKQKKLISELFILLKSAKKIDAWRYKQFSTSIVLDAYYLDTIRDREASLFSATKLRFYSEFAKSNSEAFDLLFKLVTEVRSLIEMQKDGCDEKRKILFRKYNFLNAYQSTINLVLTESNKLPLYGSLFADNQTSPERSLGESIIQTTPRPSTPEESSFLDAMNNGYLFARGIRNPATLHTNRIKDDESCIETEIRKMHRRLGIATPTKKTNRLTKDGNPNRSVTLLPSILYVGNGFLIKNPQIKDIVDIYEIDSDTGNGKKKGLKRGGDNTELTKKLEQLHKKTKMGGAIKKRTTGILAHNEVLYNMKDADAVFFTNDWTGYNEEPDNKYQRHLQALHIQQAYAQKTGIELPIYEYSFFKNTLQLASFNSDEEIINMWKSLLIEHISQILKDKEYSPFAQIK